MLYEDLERKLPLDFFSSEFDGVFFEFEEPLAPTLFAFSLLVPIETFIDSWSAE